MGAVPAQSACNKCQQSLPLSHFYSKGVGRHETICKLCSAEKKRESRRRSKLKSTSDGMKTLDPGFQRPSSELFIKSVTSNDFVIGLQVILELICTDILEAGIQDAAAD